MILLLVENLAPGMAGFDGNSIVKTPNLDRLAAEGAYFNRCYTPTPQSAPARATLLTGQYPHTHGVTSDGMSLSDRSDTFTERLHRAGYACGFVGAADVPREAADPHFGLTDFVSTDVGGRDATETGLTNRQADKAIEFVERFKDRPFFLWVSFRSPREPLEPPGENQAKYPADTIPLPKTMDVDKKAWPPKLRDSRPSVRFNQHKDEATLRQDRANYYGMITEMDAAAGRILSQLEQLGLSRNTVVVFATCHGLALGEHGLLGVGPACFEELVRGPLLIRWPAGIKAGTRIDRIVGLVDLAPTFLELAGQRPPFTLQGDSLVGLLKNPELAGYADEEFFEYDRQLGDLGGNGPDYACPIRGVVSRNYKFVDYMNNSYAFYDLQRDPEERHNLAAQLNTRQDTSYTRNYGPVLDVLRGRLLAWQKQTRDEKAK